MRLSKKKASLDVGDNVTVLVRANGTPLSPERQIDGQVERIDRNWCGVPVYQVRMIASWGATTSGWYYRDQLERKKR